jgi:hypothetical protein
MAERPERRYSIRGKSLTAAQVAELEDVTDAEQRAFALQAGLSDERLKEIQALMAAMAPPMRDFIEKTCRPLVDSIVALRSKIAELEERPTISYERTYTTDKLYKPGNLTTHAGSLWHANVATKCVAPGDGNSAWTLIVKRGRDGKDAK